MGCDYYINTVLKIVHKTGISCIRLSAEPVYLYGTNKDDDDYTIHPSKRKPKFDHMKSECEDVLIYKKGEKSMYDASTTFTASSPTTDLRSVKVAPEGCVPNAAVLRTFASWSTFSDDMDKYMILIDEYIKENIDMNYTSKNKIIIHNGLTSQNNPETGELLKDKDDIDEIYIIELRQWRP